MRARFYTITLNRQAERLSAYLEQSLSEIAIAFGHSFLMKNTTLEEALLLFKEEGAYFHVLGDESSRASTAEALHMFAQERVFSHGVQEASLLKSEETFLGSVFSPTDDKQATLAAMTGYLQAQYKSVTSAAPNTLKADDGLTPALLRLMQTPSRMGELICDFTAGQIARQAATLLSGENYYCFDTLIGNQGTLRYAHVADRPEDPHSVSPFGMYYALASTLQFGLKLQQEADCLRAAADNVLSAGWRTRDCLLSESQSLATNDQISDLIIEQISLVGELMHNR